MKILITGSSKGIGQAVANRFLENGHEVIGIDLLPASINHPNYTHHVADISKKKNLPNIKDIELVLINSIRIRHRTISRCK